MIAKHTPAPSLASEQDYEQLASLFSMLSDRTKLRILLLLAQGDRDVTSLCDELKLSRPRVSFHLGFLRNFNLVGWHRNGHRIVYGLAGRGSSGKDHLLELPVHNLVVRIVPKAKG